MKVQEVKYNFYIFKVMIVLLSFLLISCIFLYLETNNLFFSAGVFFIFLPMFIYMVSRIASSKRKYSLYGVQVKYNLMPPKLFGHNKQKISFISKTDMSTILKYMGGDKEMIKINQNVRKKENAKELSGKIESKITMHTFYIFGIPIKRNFEA